MAGLENDVRDSAGHRAGVDRHASRGGGLRYEIVAL